ncbi:MULTISPECIES: GNAT family N-acetyltransferase [Vibrio]|uniref:N-acetyltransferase n=1 Tax=Vibrio mediterranei TaxID=689 RepID=A0ABX5D9V0_9VIBR|nr:MULTISPECIES: GNAT family N-acetyltransferase [Vibrio]EDL52068.1 acetyltransferase, GNAT family protein [Vibrio mediterranei AK1]MCF4173430.1 GNAT family N-acetyltransferase [Vibrio sp. McD22-P3]MCG9661652.1 GNAT family N-acetyltransferase [Vibrio mediterranei]MCY9852813.1 GNAT family N-acetyltransferase [Vibrio mediterranei]MDA0109855.1 GNAT family N-acetyltransferase [Vibrio sp. La 4.2.2]
MKIIKDDLTGPEIKALLQAHLDDMYATSPPESVHALDIDALRQPEITFWTAWFEDDLAGCIALKTIESGHGEIKSMRTTESARGKGVARKLLAHLTSKASENGLTRLSLETGTEAFFEPARNLYQRDGFVECEPFASYSLDPNSVFMTKSLTR